MTDGKRESHTSLIFSNQTLLYGDLKSGQVKPLLFYVALIKQKAYMKQSWARFKKRLLFYVDPEASIALA